MSLNEYKVDEVGWLAETLKMEGNFIHFLI